MHQTRALAFFIFKIIEFIYLMISINSQFSLIDFHFCLINDDLKGREEKESEKGERKRG